VAMNWCVVMVRVLTPVGPNTDAVCHDYRRQLS
jgi:hypothetical protein